MRRGVFSKLPHGRRAPCTALVEHDDAVVAGVEEASVIRPGAGAGTAVQEHHRASLGIAGDLPVHAVAPVQVEPPLAEGLDRRKQVLCKHGTGWIHGLLRFPALRHIAAARPLPTLLRPYWPPGCAAKIAGQPNRASVRWGKRVYVR